MHDGREYLNIRPIDLRIASHLKINRLTATSRTEDKDRLCAIPLPRGGGNIRDIVDANPRLAITEAHGIITNNDCFFRVIPWLFTGLSS